MIIALLRDLGRATAGVFLLATAAAAQGLPPQQMAPPQQMPPQGMSPPQGMAPQGTQASNPVCVRLETQLASVNGGGDAARADQIKRAEDAVARQQADLDRAVVQGHKQGCEGQGFFSLFSSLSPQCGPITSQIQEMRGNLDRSMSNLEQLKTGTNDQDDQRRAIVGQLAQNNCGAQYTAAANANGGARGFFDALFGNGTVVTPGGDGAPSGTYHTVCVRSCDGYYFPISYSTVPSRFPDDERVCQRECPAAQATLYTYRNPGEDMNAAVSVNGQPYTALPTAFQYRKQLTPTCSCRRPGQSWADALKGADDSTTLQSGDIVVTDQNARALSQAPQPKQAKGGAPQPNATAANPAPSAASTKNKSGIRVVGPPFVSGQ
jgi:hypothetical protein